MSKAKYAVCTLRRSDGALILSTGTSARARRL